MIKTNKNIKFTIIQSKKIKVYQDLWCMELLIWR